MRGARRRDHEWRPGLGGAAELVDVGRLEVQELADLMRREAAELIDGVARGWRDWRGRSQKEPLPQDGLEALEVAEESAIVAGCRRGRKRNSGARGSLSALFLGGAPSSGKGCYVKRAFVPPMLSPMLLLSA